MKIIFAGTPEFAVPALTELLAHHTVLAVITNPDAPAQRGRTLRASTIKQTTLRIAPHIPIFTAPINTLAKELTRLAPDAIIVAAYGQILTNEILSIPRYGTLNIHPSLLPLHRGPSPIQAAILNGDAETGVTIIQLVEKMDAGPIIAQSRIKLNGSETAGDLHDILACNGAQLLIQTLKKAPFPDHAQDDAQATYTKKITSQDAELNAKEPAHLLERKIRAYNPAPGAHIIISSNIKTNNFVIARSSNDEAILNVATMYEIASSVVATPSSQRHNSSSNKRSMRLKIWRAKIKKGAHNARSFTPDKNLIIIDKLPALFCGDGNLLMLAEIQPEGKKRMSGEEFVRGYIHQ